MPDFEKAAADYLELIKNRQEEFAEAYPTNSPLMLNRAGTKWELDTDSIL